MSTYEELKSYFEVYVAQYRPYKDDIIHQQIVSFLLNYYLEHTYSGIPQDFITLYEEQTISPEFYNVILESNGFPTSIVQSLQAREKYILLQSFMDYNRYKGTVGIITRVANSFIENYNLYELFIIWDENIGDWAFTPYAIYIDPELENLELNETLDFDWVVAKTKLFYITREYLNSLRANESIVLPIKTNLLFVDYNKLYNESLLNSLLASIVFHEYKDDKILLYFESGIYQTSITQAYRLWYYILFKVYNVDMTALPGFFNIFDTTDPNFPFNVNDIATIEEEYAAINDRETLTDFYMKYINVFKQYQEEFSINSDDLIAQYEDQLPLDLLEYVNDTIVENTVDYPEKLRLNADFLLEQIYNSFITWSYSFTDSLVSTKYINYFLAILPLIEIDFTKTASYKLTAFLKPFHVELLVDQSSRIRVRDKFNSVYNSHWAKFMVKMYQATVMSIGYKYTFQNGFRIHYANPIEHDFVITHINP